MAVDLLYQLLDGLTVGIIYVLLAAGLSIIFGVMHVINFAHGELYALGAYFAIAIVAPLGTGVGFFVALIAAPVLVGVVGMGIERFTVRPLYGRNPLYHILLTFGLVLVINDLIFLIWDPVPKNLGRPDLISGTTQILGASLSRYNLFTIGVGSTIAAGTWGLLRYTRFGLIVRAGAQDRQMVRNLGIDIDNYYSLVFGLGAALAAVAGIILGSSRQVETGMGMGVIIPAFVIVVLGGLGSFRGAVAGGLLVGVLQESILRPYVPQLEGMIIFLLMIAVLLLRPQGLFGTEFEEGTEALLTGAHGGVLEPIVRRRLAFAMVGLLALVPLGGGILFSEFYVTLFVRILIWGLFALSLDFVMGYTGLVSLGHAMFWGIGAYVAGVVLVEVTHSAFLALALALLAGSTVAWVVGYLSIRVHGVYFAMITLAFAELYYSLVRRLEITGGSEGLFGFDVFYGIGSVGVNLREVGIFLGPKTLTGTSLFFYLALATVVGSFLLTRRMLNAPFGAVLKAIRENEERARFLGYNTTVYKRRAFVISGFFATLAGVLFAFSVRFVSPEAAHWLKSGEVIVMVILGGMGTLIGPIIGSFAFFFLEEVTTHFTDRWRLILGVIFVVFVILLPRGLLSLPATMQRFLNRIELRDEARGERTEDGEG
ncbi:MAG: ABC transporter permease [Halobacteriota archaeon]